MQIRRKLAIQFAAIVAIILFLFSASVYFFSANYRKQAFYDRLKSKATNVATLLLKFDEIDAALLKKIETDNPTSLPNEKITVYNYKNEVLYSSDDNHTLKVDDALLDQVRLNDEIRFTQGKDEVLGFLFTSKYDRFVVIAGAEDIYGFKKLANLRLVLFIAFGISLVLTFLAGSIYAGRALVPIARVIRQVNDIGVHSMNLRVEEGNGKDEIAALAHTFNNMLDRIEAAMKIQKDFISNASHELRNPLTAITGQLEVTLLNTRTPEEYKQTIASVLEDIQNLNRIANKLLLLAQTSADSEPMAMQTLRIDDIIWQARSEILKRDPKNSVHVIFDDSMDENKLSVKGNEQLLRSAIQNILDNGCKYSAAHRTEVRISTPDAHVQLLFRDAGIGISEEDLRHIFEPFHRGKNVENIRGHGIGLSLVQQIMRLHNGHISITSGIGKGTTVEVSLPSL